MEFPYSQVAERYEQDDDESSDNEDWFFIAHQSAGTGDIPTLMEAIKHDPSVLEYQDNEGMTPLTHAVAGHQLETMKLLVKMGASINTVDTQGRTPLSVAAYQGWYDGVVFLMRNGAKQHIADKTGRLPLHAATYDNDTRTISVLLQNLGIEEVNEQDNEGMTALHWAAFHNRPEHVQLLMLKGSDIYSVDIDGKTPLHWAAQNGSTPCCSVLVGCQSGGARLVNIIDASGKTCVHLAAAAGHSDVLRELSKIQHVYFEAGDPDDRTPLHWAAATGQARCVEMLLSLNVNNSAQDCMGGTPLDYAKQSGHENVAAILLAHNAKYGSMKPDVSEVAQTPMSNTSANTSNKKSRFGFLSNLFSSRKGKDKGQDGNSNDEASVASGEMTSEDTDSASGMANKSSREAKMSQGKPEMRTRASRSSVISAHVVNLSTQESSNQLSQMSAVANDTNGMQQHNILDRRKNLPPLDEQHPPDMALQKHGKHAPPLLRQKQVVTRSPGEQRANLHVLSPIPPVTKKKVKSATSRVDDLSPAEEFAKTSPTQSLNTDSSPRATLQKYSPLPSPVAMRRGHSDPTSTSYTLKTGNQGNSGAPGAPLRPLGKGASDLATHVETTSQQILAAQRADKGGSLHPLRSMSPISLSQGATPHGSPKLAPLKGVRGKLATPASFQPSSNQAPFQASASEDRSDYEDDKQVTHISTFDKFLLQDNALNRPRSKSLQTTGDVLERKSASGTYKNANLSGIPHKNIDPLLLPISPLVTEKSHKKKKKKNKNKRASSMEEIKKGNSLAVMQPRRPSEEISSSKAPMEDDFELAVDDRPLTLRREVPKQPSMEHAKSRPLERHGSWKEQDDVFAPEEPEELQSGKFKNDSAHSKYPNYKEIESVT
ncbi:uncharacterized protein [Ptychodera flava]|uniref:uncharacterized protein n=1 Tax=Ptychodera flava TaxID=63121 RepID=UPI00396AA88D